jgi:ABC-type transporter Mla subunit MlaD
VDLTDIKSIVDAHTETLAEHGRDLTDIKASLATITGTLGEILTAVRPAK